MSPESTPWLLPVVVVAAWLALASLEASRPLRRRTQPRTRRWLRNGGTGAISWAVARPLQLVLLVPVAALCREHGIGLLSLVKLPPALDWLVALVLLDGTLWYWHWANHRLGLLWRFHAVHHEDRDLDASSALRFHFGELALSVGWRSLQAALIGVSATQLATYAGLLTVAAMFHHANLRLPLALERRLVHLIVTPRMHGIHHSTVLAETDSNYSSLLSIWDRLHGTLRLDRPQDEIVIGLPGSAAQPRAAGLWRLQVLPFVASSRPDAGSVTQPPEGGSRTRLAE